MPEIATETSPNEVRCDVTASTNDVRSVADVRITDVTKAVSALTTEVKTGDLDTSLSYDAPPFVPRSVITETKLLAAFKNQVLSSSEFDSGCDTSAKPNSRSENEEIPFVKPDEDLTKRIIDQVEFYFSDENIVKDAFLLKHVKRNKEGFVSLKLISSFKRVKHLSKDWRVVAFALAKSTKIRRVDPLPAYDQTTPSRTIVAINIPPESATIELVAEMFKPCGEIALIRLLRPGLTVMELNAPASKVKRERPVKKLSMIRHHVFNDSTDYTSSCPSGSETETKFIQRRCSSPQMFPEGTGNHWVQRKWSRDSGSDSPGSTYSRSRSNSGVGYYIPPDRRVSVGWDSSSSEYSTRSRSNSSVSNDMRRFSVSSRDSNAGECCCCSGHRAPPSVDSHSPSSDPPRRYSFSKQFAPHASHHHAGQHSHSAGSHHAPGSGHHSAGSHDEFRRKDSTGSQDFFCMTRSRSNSGSQGFPERRVSFNDNFRPRTSSSSSSDSFRRSSFTRDPLRANVPDQLVRLPRGPDGSRGFQLIDYSIHE
ncbi:hypothetical protein M8J75_002205 [Diaphorina citri]|nr:hypothetical protein M8J75_002205 [Diaphorina citri]